VRQFFLVVEEWYPVLAIVEESPEPPKSRTEAIKKGLIPDEKIVEFSDEEISRIRSCAAEFNACQVLIHARFGCTGPTDEHTLIEMLDVPEGEKK